LNAVALVSSKSVGAINDCPDTSSVSIAGIGSTQVVVITIGGVCAFCHWWAFSGLIGLAKTSGRNTRSVEASGVLWKSTLESGGGVGNAKSGFVIADVGRTLVVRFCDCAAGWGGGTANLSGWECS